MHRLRITGTPWTFAPVAILTLAFHGGCSSTDGSGNDVATGGSAASTGGSSSSDGTGGAPAGSGGSTGGSAGSGGNVSAGTPGCGRAAPESSRYTIDVNGTSREYILEVPENYDPDHPYPVVFGWHWRGGDAAQVANGQGASFGPYYGLQALAEGSVIFVSPEGLVDNGQSGWANPMGRDIAFASAMLDRFESELCIDTERVFSTGFSFGGMFSFAVGCALGDRFRAIAPIAGSLWSGCAAGTDPVAVWGTHGATDTVVEIPFGRTARDEFLTRNGCNTSSTPTEPSGCVRYDGCEDGYPVVWCEYNDGHWPPNYAAAETWKFFSSF